MLLHVTHVQYTLLTVLAFARHEHVVLVFVEMRDQMSVEEVALHVAELLVVGQHQTLQAVRTKVAQCRLVLLLNKNYSKSVISQVVCFF